MHRRLSSRQPEARGPALGSFQQPVPTLVRKIDTVRFEQGHRLPCGEREIARTDLHQPSLEPEPVQSNDRISRAQHQSQRRARTGGEQFEPGDRDRVGDQMNVVDDEHSGRGQFHERVGQIPPAPFEAAVRCRPRDHRQWLTNGNAAGRQDAATFERARQMCPEISTRIPVDGQPRNRHRRSGGGDPRGREDGFAGAGRPADHGDATAHASIKHLPQTGPGDMGGRQRRRGGSRDDDRQRPWTGYARVGNDDGGSLRVNHLSTPNRSAALGSGIATRG